LESSLAHLQAREFIYEELGAGDVEYTFKHALTQEVAYNSVLTETRKAIHARVGAAIEALWPESLDDHLNQLAHHYGRSANAAKAVEFLTRAAEKASSRSAEAEADAYLKSALAQIERLPEQTRAAWELRLQLQTCQAARVLGGDAAPAVGVAATRALELARSLADRSGEMEANAFLYFYHEWSGHFSPLREIAETMLRQAEESGEPRLLVAAHHHFGTYFIMHTFDYPQARQHYEKAIAAYNSTSDHSDPRMKERFAVVHGALGIVLGGLGFLDQAVATSRRALEIAREDGRSFLVGWALDQQVGVYRMRGDIDETLAAVEALQSLVEEYGLTDHDGQVLVARGWATARKGQLTHNLEMMNLGLETLRAALNTNLVVGAQIAIAEVAIFADDAKALLAAVQTMESWGPLGEGLNAFLVQLLKGYSLVLSGAEADAREAEAIFRWGFDHARKWQFKLSELHAAMGLARLMVRTGRRNEARTVLAETYGSFTEGFDATYLKDAKTLLDDLSD
jgi:tetratricopeptide (TPR) repeat protein